MRVLLSFSKFIGLAFLSQAISAQSPHNGIKGRVITADGSATNATIQLIRLNRVTRTDQNGNFQFLDLPTITDTLVITTVEFSKQKMEVKLDKGKLLNLGNIYLDFTISQLKEIQVRGSIGHSYKSENSFLGSKTQIPYLDIPQTVSAITKEFIKDRMLNTLKDAADYAAGVNDYSGYEEYSIRGFRAENATLINGLRGYNTTYTSAMLLNMEKIEIIKGPSATLYGNCDPGGTINLVTKKPLPESFGEINMMGGKWDHFRVLGDFTGPLNTPKTALYRLNAGYDNAHSFRSQYFGRSFAIAPSISIIPSDKIRMNIDFSLSHIRTILDRGQPGIKNDPTLLKTPIQLIATQPGDHLLETDFASTLSFSYKINKRLNFNCGYLNYITQQSAADHGVHSYISPDSVNMFFSTWDYHTITNTLTNYFTFHTTGGKFNYQFTAGYDYINSKVKLGQQYYEDKSRFAQGSGIVTTFSLIHPKYNLPSLNQYSLSDYESDATNIEASVYHTQGVYLQSQIDMNKWKLFLGVREELYKAEDAEADTADEEATHVFLPRIGLVYSLQKDVSLYATYNKGFDPFEASTSTQLFHDPFKPITSELMEIGAKANFFRDKLVATIAFYQLIVHNVAVNANDISNPNLFVQEGKDMSRGVETEINGNILPNLSISSSYSYCEARVIKSRIVSQQGSLVENAPRNQSNSWIKYLFKKGYLKNFGLASGHSQVGLRNTLEPGLVLPSYTIINASLRYEYRNLNLAINFNNIFNKRYWTSAYNNVNKWPGSPANFMLSARYAF